MAGEQNSEAGSPQRSISFNVNGVSRLQNNTKLDGASVSTSGCPPTPPTCRLPRPSRKSASSPTPSTPSRAWPAGAAINVITSRGRTSSAARPGSTTSTAISRPGISSRRRRRATRLGGLGRRGFELAAAQEQPGHAAPVRRQPRRPHRQGQAVLLRQLGALRQEARTRPQRFVSIPTDALRRGDFSGTGVTIYDPASNTNPALRTPFPNNTIPANRIDPAAL